VRDLEASRQEIASVRHDLGESVATLERERAAAVRTIEALQRDLTGAALRVVAVEKENVRTV
jgi:hypothetical protein